MNQGLFYIRTFRSSSVSTKRSYGQTRWPIFKKLKTKDIYTNAELQKE